MEDAITRAIRAIVREEARAIVVEEMSRAGRRQKANSGVLNSEQAAEYCGYSGGGQAMRSLVYRGTGPKMYKHGSRNLYYPSDLDEWLRRELIPAN